LHEHEEDRPVVVLLLADPPRLRGRDRELLERRALGKAGEDDHEELRARLVREAAQLLVHARGLVGRNEPRVVVEERRGRRRNLVRRARRRGRREERDRREDEPHPDYLVGAGTGADAVGAGVPNWTWGAVDAPASALK